MIKNLKGTFDYMPKDMKVRNDIIGILRSNFEKYGYSVKSLAWIKGKQNIRFDALTKFWNLDKTFSISLRKKSLTG